MILNDLMKAGALLAIKLDDEDEINSVFDVTGTIAFEDTPYGKGMVFNKTQHLVYTRANTLASNTAMVLCKVTGSGTNYILDSRNLGDEGSVYLYVPAVTGELTGTGSVYKDGVIASGTIGSDYLFASISFPSNTPATQIRFGNRFTDEAQGFGGTIVAIIVFPFTLTTADMLAVQNGITGYQKSLVHHWRMDSTSPRDLVGEAHGTAIGTPTVVETGTGEGLQLDGATDAVGITAPATTGTLAMRVRWDGGAASLMSCATGTLTVDAAGALTASAGTKYVDGVAGVTLVAGKTQEVSVTGITLSGAGNIGANAAADGLWFAGSVSDVRIFNRALTPLEVRHLHATVSQEYGVSV